jgi:hypothetical protein
MHPIPPNGCRHRLAQSSTDIEETTARGQLLEIAYQALSGIGLRCLIRMRGEVVLSVTVI